MQKAMDGFRAQWDAGVRNLRIGTVDQRTVNALVERGLIVRTDVRSVRTDGFRGYGRSCGLPRWHEVCCYELAN